MTAVVESEEISVVSADRDVYTVVVERETIQVVAAGQAGPAGAAGADGVDGAQGPPGTGLTGLVDKAVLFGTAAGGVAQDGTNFVWDDTNKRLGIGTSVPAAALDVRGQARVGDPAGSGLASGLVFNINTDFGFASASGGNEIFIRTGSRILLSFADVGAGERYVQGAVATIGAFRINTEAGSASNVSYGFQGADKNTGFYMPVSGAVALVTGGTEAVRFVGGHTVNKGTAPSITAGGGTGPAILGKDESFTVTIGTGGPTSFEVTFANAFMGDPPSIPMPCSDTDQITFTVASTTTKVTVTSSTAMTAGSKVHVVCRGWE